MRKVGIIAIFMMIPAWMWAQESLSLADAIALGLKNNYSIQIADLEAEIAQNNNTWGNAGRWPRVDLDVNGSWFKTGNPASFSPGRASASINPNVSWVLFDGFRISANKARFELLETQSLGNASLIVEANIQAIILGYQNAQVASNQLEVLQEVLNNSKERLDYESYRKELGASGTFELLQFQTAVVTDSANLLLERQNYTNALRNLNLVMGVAPETNYVLSDALSEEVKPYRFQDLQDRMMADNFSLKNQLIRRQIFEKETRIAKGAMYPTLSINGGTTYSAGRVTLRNRDPETAEETPTYVSKVSAFDYTAGVSLSFNLFNGGNTRRLIENAKITEQISLVESDELTNTLTRDLQITWDDYQLQGQLFRLRKENVDLAKTNLDLAEEKFKSGLINSFDYRNIQLQYLNAQFARLQVLQNLKEAETELIRLTGGLIRA